MYNEMQLKSLGEAIGKAVKGGEVIELVGDVGAGKTTLTRAIARGMGISEPIQSPTFTIVNRYEVDGRILTHYDFYRLNDAGMMREELREALSDNLAVVVIEWAGIVADVLPDEKLSIRLIAVSETERRIEMNAKGEQMTRILEAVS